MIGGGNRKTGWHIPNETQYRSNRAVHTHLCYGMYQNPLEMKLTWRMDSQQIGFQWIRIQQIERKLDSQRPRICIGYHSSTDEKMSANSQLKPVLTRSVQNRLLQKTTEYTTGLPFPKNARPTMFYTPHLLLRWRQCSHLHNPAESWFLLWKACTPWFQSPRNHIWHDSTPSGEDAAAEGIAALPEESFLLSFFQRK